VGADDLEDEGIHLPDEVRGGPLVMPAQSLETGLDIEAVLSHGSIYSESTQR
jgi:hypothetical protein